MPIFSPRGLVNVIKKSENKIAIVQTVTKLAILYKAIYVIGIR